MTDPKPCDFCEDDDQQPSAGRVLIVYQDTFEEAAPSEFVACRSCAGPVSGALIGIHRESGRSVFFQFEHYEFGQVADQVDAFAIYLDSVVCIHCEEKIWPSDAPLGLVAGRMLRMEPSAHYIRATCSTCKALHGCEDCDESHEHD